LMQQGRLKLQQPAVTVTRKEVNQSSPEGLRWIEH